MEASTVFDSIHLMYALSGFQNDCVGVSEFFSTIGER
jgi:hypothetical protein